MDHSIRTGFEYHNPVRIVFASGAFEQLPQLSEVKNRRCMFLGYEGFNLSRLENVRSSAETFHVHDAFEENPSLDFVRTAAEIVRSADIETIVAVGGGSTIDTAKAASYLAANPGWVPGDPPAGTTRCSVVAVPTTAGTGSEVSPYAILADPNGAKKIVADPAVYPTVAVCDPSLTHGLPRGVTANTGIDAISHSVEAYLNRKSGGFMPALAQDSLSRIQYNLPLVLEEPTNARARSEMMLAALEGGMLLAACGTVIVHALGYELSKSWNLAHGFANGLLLNRFVQIMAQKGSEEARTILRIFHDDLGGFIERVGIAADRREHRLTDDLLHAWTASGIRSYGITNAVRPLGEDDIRDILASSLR